MKIQLAILNLIFICTLQIGFSQTVEINGQLKVATVPLNNTATDIVIRNTDGTFGKRAVSTIGGETPGTAQGQMKYWLGSSWVLLPPGLPGQFLSVDNLSYPKWMAIGRKTVRITGNITNAQAAAQLAVELGSITENLYIHNTTGLTEIYLNNAPQLEILEVNNNAHLTTLECDNLGIINSRLLIQQNPALSYLTFNSLTKYLGTGQFVVHQNPALSSLSFPSLTTLGNESDYALSVNGFTVATVNNLLIKFASLMNFNMDIFLIQGHVPAAPPSGAGITAKNTMIASGVTVLTD